jgi:hypothetical protein
MWNSREERTKEWEPGSPVTSSCPGSCRDLDKTQEAALSPTRQPSQESVLHRLLTQDAAGDTVDGWCTGTSSTYVHH